MTKREKRFRRDNVIPTLIKQYETFFDSNFDRKLNKTAWHFFAFVNCGVGETATSTVRKFRQDCAKCRARATWRNAVRWWCLGKEGLK